VAAGRYILARNCTVEGRLVKEYIARTRFIGQCGIIENVTRQRRGQGKSNISQFSTIAISTSTTASILSAQRRSRALEQTPGKWNLPATPRMRRRESTSRRRLERRRRRRVIDTYNHPGCYSRRIPPAEEFLGRIPNCVIQYRRARRGNARNRGRMAGRYHKRTEAIIAVVTTFTGFLTVTVLAPFREFAGMVWVEERWTESLHVSGLANRRPPHRSGCAEARRRERVG